MNCTYCGRPLKTLQSLARGAGPKCLKKSPSRLNIDLKHESIETLMANAGSGLLKDVVMGGAIQKFVSVNDGRCLLIKTPMLELNDSRSKELAKNETDVELACNKIADRLNMTIAPYGIVRAKDVIFFATEIFTVRLSKNKDFISDIGILTPISEFLGGDSDFFKMKLLIESQSSCPEVDIQKFIEMTIFDGLIGNMDRHNDNIAFLTVNNKTILSPMYDNVSWVNPISDVADVEKLRGKFSIDGHRASFVELLNACDSISQDVTMIFCRKILSHKLGITNIDINVVSNDKSKALFKQFIAMRMDDVTRFVTSSPP